jgi:hypothetical protein
VGERIGLEGFPFGCEVVAFGGSFGRPLGPPGPACGESPARDLSGRDRLVVARAFDSRPAGPRLSGWHRRSCRHGCGRAVRARRAPLVHAHPPEPLLAKLAPPESFAALGAGPAGKRHKNRPRPVGLRPVRGPDRRSRPRRRSWATFAGVLPAMIEPPNPFRIVNRPCLPLANRPPSAQLEHVAFRLPHILPR